MTSSPQDPQLERDQVDLEAADDRELARRLAEAHRQDGAQA